MSLKKINYLDLFSGMGGFHKAAEKIKEKEMIFCGAADTEPSARKFYKQNYEKEPKEDIRWFKENELNKKINMIFAGFPCQPFSSAGNRKGFDHKKGNLFWELMAIIKKYKPEMILLENVSNFKNHDNGNTWKTIKSELEKLYHIPEMPIQYSPHKMGHPELRKRVYIPGFLKSKYKKEIQFDKYEKNLSNEKIKNLNTFKIKNNKQIPINELQKKSIQAWDQLLKKINYKMVKPAWGQTWNERDGNYLSKPYSEGQKIIQKNKEFYFKNKKIIDQWKQKHNFEEWLPTYKKLEWNVSKTNYKSCLEGIIQFRPSGIRVKEFTTLPTMVALNQTPFIGPWNRFITPEEVASIQGYGKNIKYKDIKTNKMFKMLGNNVNVHVTESIIKEMINE